MLKSVFKVLISNAALTIAGLLSSFIFPVLLSMDDYAYYQEYMLYLSYVNICHLGIASGMFLDYAGKKYESIDKSQYKSEVYLIYIVLSFFTFCGFFIYGIYGNKLILYVTVTIIPQCLIASFQALYQAWERFTAYSVINALPKILFIAMLLLIFCVLKAVNARVVVYTYIIIMWGISLYFITEFIRFTKGIKGANIFSRKNIKTSWNGFLITLGNYVNLLFHSIDKQFVHVLYSLPSFAQYSFAMSMQSIMTIFITALANPFYPRLAKEDSFEDFLPELKQLLFIFGAYSGCAYFVISFFVKHFIKKYIDSLSVVAMFFSVFPAMAVINVLYINLYKLRKLLKKYICTLVGILGVAIILNTIAVVLHGGYRGIAFATMVTYYVWLFYSQRDFAEIRITKRDIVYLSGFFLLYYLSMAISNDMIGFLVYGILITIWVICIYRKTLKLFWHKTVKRIKGRTQRA